MLPTGETVDLNHLFEVADKARAREKLTPKDVALVKKIAPEELVSGRKLPVPATVRHPAGFTLTGAPVGTFARSALLLAGGRVLGQRYGESAFYTGVERDLAFGIMRSHFHNGYPKGRSVVRARPGGRSWSPGRIVSSSRAMDAGLRRDSPGFPSGRWGSAPRQPSLMPHAKVGGSTHKPHGTPSRSRRSRERFRAGYSSERQTCRTDGHRRCRNRGGTIACAVRSNRA